MLDGKSATRLSPTGTEENLNGLFSQEDVLNRKPITKKIRSIRDLERKEGDRLTQY